MSYETYSIYFPVTPHNVTNNQAKALYVGTGGNVIVEPALGNSGDRVTFYNVPAGTLLPVGTRKVIDTGTTAKGIVALGW